MAKGSKPGERRGGREKGTPNKLSSLARDAIAHAAAKLGGAKRLAEWAKEDPANESAFWSRIYPRLLPVQVHASGPNGEPLPPMPASTVTIIQLPDNGRSSAGGAG